MTSISDIYSKNKLLRFVKIRKGTKKPFEEDWVNKPYTWSEIQPHINSEVNFGVLCGYADLIVIDCDTKEDGQGELPNHIKINLPKTFTVITGSGGRHFYYFCPLEKKIILNAKGKHWGEVQTKGQQVIAAGSIHTSGKTYNVENDDDIATITTSQLYDAISVFVDNSKEDKKAIDENKQAFGKVT